MMEMLLLLIHVGGCQAFEEHEDSFWKTICWPYYLGKRLGYYAHEARRV